MLSEIDLRDWIMVDPKPLYDCETSTPVQVNGSMYWFDHIDGMFSVCYDMAGNLTQWSAWTEANPFIRKDKKP